MSKFKRSWLLFKSSMSIMMQNRQLLVFPIVVFLFTMLIVLFFLAPVVLRPTGYSFVSTQHWQTISRSLFIESTDANGRAVETLSSFAIGYLAVMYFISMFFATFFNVAFYHEILAALHAMESSSYVDAVCRSSRLDHSTDRRTIGFHWSAYRTFHRHGMERRIGLCDSAYRAGREERQSNKDAKKFRQHLETNLGRSIDRLCWNEPRQWIDIDCFDGRFSQCAHRIRHAEYLLAHRHCRIALAFDDVRAVLSDECRRPNL